MIIDGKAVAESLYEELLKKRASIMRDISLGIVIVGENPAIASFVRIKERAAARLDVTVIREDVPDTSMTQGVIAAVQSLVAVCDAVIVQLPLPQHIDTEKVLATVPPEKDVDATNPLIPHEKRIVRAPVAGAVEAILTRHSIDPKGKKAVVVGAGRLVGIPVAAMLRSRGADVSIVTLQEGSLDALKSADIAVLGAGNPGFVKPEMLKDGVVLIDAGTSEAGGKIAGDADPACVEKASLFTPVPGGVGPIAVAMIFQNLFELARR